MTDTPANPAQSAERIAKVIARSGVASRRDAEKMILAGRVSVNGKLIESPALDVTPKDKVMIDGKPIDAPQETRMWLYYKPLGLVTTEKDEQGRRTIFDEMPAEMPRVLNVGRLDLNSEGLLLLTNDGGLKRRLELPETGWLRKYRVRVNGRPTEATFDPLRRGITIDGEEFQPMEISLDRQQGANAWLTVGIREGKNREIRRAMTEIGLTVNRLIRVSYGPFRLNDMNPGDVVEIRRKMLRDQLGDRLLTGAEDGRLSKSEREEQSAAKRQARLEGVKDRAERGDRGDRPERGPRKDRGPRPEGRSEGRGESRGPRGGEDSPRKGFGRQKDFAERAPREGAGEERARKPRWSADKRSNGFKSHRDRDEGGDKPFRKGGYAKSSRDGDAGRGPRSEGFKPRSEGYKPRGEGGRSEGYKPRGEGFKPRSEGYKPRGEGGRSEGYKARGEGTRSEGYKPRGEGFKPKGEGYKPRGDAPRSEGKPGGYKSHGAKTHGGKGKPRASGFKSHGERPSGGRGGPRKPN